MKKLFFILSITFLMLQSCSSGDDSTNPDNPVPNGGVLLKKIEFSNGMTLNYQYTGNKLYKLTGNNGEGSSIVIYSGDLITQVNSYDNNNKLVFTHNYFYTNNELIRSTWVDDYGDSNQTDYVYYPGGKVTLNSKTTRKNNPNIIYSSTESYFISNGNIVNIESNGKVESHTYDSKNSPWKNIIGFLKINTQLSLGDNIFYNTNNNLTILNPLRSGSNSPIISTYQYNSQGYPTSCTQSQVGGVSFTMSYTYY